MTELAGAISSAAQTAELKFSRNNVSFLPSRTGCKKSYLFVCVCVYACASGHSLLSGAHLATTPNERLDLGGKSACAYYYHVVRRSASLPNGGDRKHTGRAGA